MQQQPKVDYNRLSVFAEQVAVGLFNVFPEWQSLATIDSEVMGEGDLKIEVPSPMGKPDRNLVIQTNTPGEKILVHAGYPHDIEFVFDAKRFPRENAMEKFLSQFLSRIQDFIAERAVLGVVRHQVLFLHSGRTLTIMPLEQLRETRPRGLSVVRSWRGTYDEGTEN